MYGDVVSSSLQLTLSIHYHQDIHTRADTVVTLASACAVQSDIRSSVHAPYARDRNRLSAMRSHCVLSQFPRAHGFIHFLAGLHMQPTAHLFHLLHSEFPMVVEIVLHMTLKLWSPGSQTLSLREYMFPTGLLLMSRFVF